MKKNILLVLFLFFVVCVCNVDAVPEYKVLTDEEGWTIIESLLEDSGVKLYLKGDETSEKVIIDVERSLESTNRPVWKVGNVLYNIFVGTVVDFYGIDYYQLYTMLAFASQMPFQADVTDVTYFTDEWYRNFLSFGADMDSCVAQFKAKFPACKNIELKLHSLRKKEIMVHNSNEMNIFLAKILHNELKLIYEHDDSAQFLYSCMPVFLQE